MKSLNITGSKRTDMTKQAIKKLRNEGKVPCVLYGGKENVHFVTPAFDFRSLVYTPNVHTVNLNIDGSQYNAVMRDIQYHPINDRILHIDFFEISNDKEVEMRIPVRVKGSAEGVKAGGRLIQKLKKVHVSALPADLPDAIEIDITPLNIGDSVRVESLKKEGVTFLDAPNNIVVGVRVTRVVVEETPVAAATTAPVAGAAAPAAAGATAAPAAAGAAAAAPAAAGKTPAKEKK